MSKAKGPTQGQCTDCGQPILGGNRKRCPTCAEDKRSRIDTARKRQRRAEAKRQVEARA